MLAKVETANRLMVKITQGEGIEAIGFARQRTFNAGALGLRHKCHRLLKRQRYAKRPGVGRQPEFDFSALRRIPPVSGQHKPLPRFCHAIFSLKNQA